MDPLRLTLPACSALLTALCLVACGETSPSTPAEHTITTPPATVTHTTEPATASPAAAVKKRVPNVVGMNLQTGQDTLQAAGFYVLDDQDATGQGRLQIYDRNWVVTRQSPIAGRTVTPDTLITLYAKKIGE
ncbi:PASTA domain-containing protein [Nonomuraea zeae]|uniref:PASTA domain-containing protein n=1 Tax=Nonomuraea zeae TaxID=1642303 RepID=A0A5S4GT39_9ACTN|nr:PASTA domain-containing protein [Nonomuraea zeae]TMR36097.1 PASTA domain-containing protein [Nonomuraea zeae]